MGRPAVNIKGETYGKLTAINYMGNSMWECLCECGNTKVARYTDLKLGKTTTCGKLANYLKKNGKKPEEEKIEE